MHTCSQESFDLKSYYTYPFEKKRAVAYIPFPERERRVEHEKSKINSCLCVRYVTGASL